jgi:tartrate-resistant acid phosphatase type 5
VSGPDDPQWQEKFEAPYAALDFPFYAVLGNHDYGGGGGGMEEDRAQAQVDYSAVSDKFRMPARAYSHVHGDVTFVGLDTTPLDWGMETGQAEWLAGELAAAQTSWVVAYGHHPYRSNGSHGNANENFAPFFEANVCGNADVWFAGHDHSLQWIETPCEGTELIVSGGGGASTYGNGDENPTHFEAGLNGFVWVEIDGPTLTGVFYDETATELYRRSITR